MGFFEDKELLLKDLCARLPYEVKVNVIYSNKNASSFRQRVCIEGDNELNTDIMGLYQCNEIDIRPYLFPLSSMSEEQKKFIKNNFCYDWDIDDHPYSWWAQSMEIGDVDKLIDWYNKNHFDYRGLIPKDLGIDATGLNIY